MKVLLISSNRQKVGLAAFPIGLNLVAAATRNAGHDVRLFDYFTQSDPETSLAETIREFKPEAVGVSIRNIDSQSIFSKKLLIENEKRTIELVRELTGVPVIAGGAGFSIMPHAALEFCGADYGIHGEGEESFPALLAALEYGATPDAKKIPGLVTPGDNTPTFPAIVSDMSTLHNPGFDTWNEVENRENIWLPAHSRRGCPMKCAYCATSSIEGTRLRFRPPGEVVKMLESGVEAGFSHFFFTDNNFNFPPSYAKDLCREIAAANLPAQWRAIVYPHNIDEELVSLMKAAGCVEVSMGLESGCDHILESLGKNYTVKDVAAINKLLMDHDIKRVGFLMFGAPGETRESVRQSLEFAEELHLNMLRMTAGIRIYPGTALAQRAIEEGVISADDSLLEPRFYVAGGLREWLMKNINSWTEGKHNWLVT